MLGKESGRIGMRNTQVNLQHNPSDYLGDRIEEPMREEAVLSILQFAV